MRTGRDLTYAAGAIWYACGDQPYLWKIDPATESVVQRLRIGGRVGSPTPGNGMVWVPDMATGWVVGVDASTGRIERKLKVGSVVEQLRVDGSTMWVRVSDIELAQVDLRRLTVVERFDLPAAPSPVAASPWASTRSG